MKWQRRARIGVAIFGIACAIVVYAAIGEREKTVLVAPPERTDPKATIESTGAQVQQNRGTQRDFDIKSDRTLFYENGASKMFGVQVNVRGREGRDFALTAREAQAGADRRELALSGNVKLAASDGFELHTGEGSFNQDDGIVRAPGEVRFAKGRMSGSGLGMTYDQTNDVLTLPERAHVNTVADGQNQQMDFTSGSAVLNRAADSLQLTGEVHALRGEQTFAADAATARLTADESAITDIELRGNASVAGGGGSLDSMSARDIDLHYSADGQTLEQVLLVGGAALALAAQNGAAGRQMIGERLEVTLAADGAVTRVTGADNVQLLLPATDGTSKRTVAAKTLEAAGEPGKGLTSVRFTDNVEYREDAQPRAAARTARARGLRVTLDGDAIDSATFTGSVIFEEEGLQASAAEALYEPTAGTLRLTGIESGRPPRVAEQRINIEAQQRIDVTLEGRRMDASGGVKTTLRAAGGSAKGQKDQKDQSKLPGLLKEEQPVNVNADSLKYEGASGKVIYTGRAELWQGSSTTIRGDLITIDQQSGDLIVSGAARSDILLDMERSIARATEIRYDDARRVIRYLSSLPDADARLRPPAPTPAPQAQVSGPQGDLRANRIEVVLAQNGGRAERLEAYVNVTARIDTRLATGARLTYFAEDQRYVMIGAGAVPVKVNDGCRESIGKTVTFFKSADRIIIDGNEEIRTQTKSGGACAAAPPAAR
jgi:LPS export ABC transporter protein LptC